MTVKQEARMCVVYAQLTGKQATYHKVQSTLPYATESSSARPQATAVCCGTVLSRLCGSQNTSNHEGNPRACKDKGVDLTDLNAVYILFVSTGLLQVGACFLGAPFLCVSKGNHKDTQNLGGFLFSGTTMNHESRG